MAGLCCSPASTSVAVAPAFRHTFLGAPVHVSRPRVPAAAPARRASRSGRLHCVALKENQIELDGEIVKNLPGKYFSVQLENGFVVQAYMGSRIRIKNTRLVVGDRVKVELSVLDLTKGRITQRYLSPAEIARIAAIKAAEDRKKDKK